MSHPVRPDCHGQWWQQQQGQGKPFPCDSGQEADPGQGAWEAQEPSSELKKI